MSRREAVFSKGLSLNYPKSATITAGLIKGDQAHLEIAGTNNEGKKIKGDVLMKKAAGNWRVVDMSFYGSD